jgi:ATP-dependent RNA helicase DDX20
MKRSHDVAINEKIEFDSLLQNKQLLQGLKQSGYQQPSPVQLKAIPLGRLGMDLVAQAKSGTGKTVVFSVIALESIQAQIKLPQVIMVAPTREIAVQIRDVVRGLAVCMPLVQCHSFIGGLPTPPETLTHCQVVVATPGRLMALLESKKLVTSRVQLVVLDEADKLMSDTFRPQIQSIFDKLKKTTHQTIAFSATFTETLMDQLNSFLKNPQIVRLTDGVPTLNGMCLFPNSYRQELLKKKNNYVNRGTAILH